MTPTEAALRAACGQASFCLRELLPTHPDAQMTVAMLTASLAAQPTEPPPSADGDARWQPIETAPESGYMLVYEDEAIRAQLRFNGKWQDVGYPMIVSHPWSDHMVGADAQRLLPPGFKLAIGGGVIESPTHWMPLPKPPAMQERDHHGSPG